MEGSTGQFFLPEAPKSVKAPSIETFVAGLTEKEAVWWMENVSVIKDKGAAIDALVVALSRRIGGVQVKKS